MTEAICLRCGSEKRRPWQQCSTCGFTPQDDEDSLLKSVYLSVGRFDDFDEQTEYRKELAVLAERLRAGMPIEFDARELARLAEQRDLVRSVKLISVLAELVRMFMPHLLVIGLLLFTLWMVRHWFPR